MHPCQQCFPQRRSAVMEDLVKGIKFFSQIRVQPRFLEQSMVVVLFKGYFTLQGLFPGQGSTAFSGAEHGHGTLQGLDVTKVPNEGQTQTLGRQSDTTWTTTEEMKKNPDNATTDDDHINGNLVEVRERRRNIADAEPHDPTANRWTTRLSATTKTSTNTKKAATTYTAILLLRILRRQSKRRARTVGPTT